ncbi:CxxxxCH/CxxCH domain-containing protein [Exiguobacterium sp. s122]|uniref:CxxxxCH/CxxCH domain-containing protein n=1 Tax=Exiguobacterium sp. s122 TaxID=2751220 RepID=UPI00333BE052
MSYKRGGNQHGRLFNFGTITCTGITCHYYGDHNKESYSVAWRRDYRRRIALA